MTQFTTGEENAMSDANVNAAPLVGIIMGSQSDMAVMEDCAKQLEAFGVPFEIVVASAHRQPAKVHDWAAGAADRGIRVIVAAAGKAAHLGGVVAAYTTLPVITVPMKTSDLGGLDSLLSMVQMPTGVPVACVAINGAKNAAILATQGPHIGSSSLVALVPSGTQRSVSGTGRMPGPQGLSTSPSASRSHRPLTSLNPSSQPRGSATACGVALARGTRHFRVPKSAMWRSISAWFGAIFTL